MAKRFICILLGCFIAVNCFILGQGLTPPIKYYEYTVSQPSGETFQVYTTDEPYRIHPPFPAGTLMQADVPAYLYEPDDYRKTYSYYLILDEDGYWCYRNCIGARVIPLDNPEEEFTVLEEGEWKEEYENSFLYDIDLIYGEGGRFLVDPLPEKLWMLGNPFRFREVSPTEQENMRLILSGETVTSDVSSSDIVSQESSTDISSTSYEPEFSSIFETNQEPETHDMVADSIEKDRSEAQRDTYTQERNPKTGATDMLAVLCTYVGCGALLTIVGLKFAVRKK